MARLFRIRLASEGAVVTVNEKDTGDRRQPDQISIGFASGNQQWMTIAEATAVRDALTCALGEMEVDPE